MFQDDDEGVINLRSVPVDNNNDVEFKINHMGEDEHLAKDVASSGVHTDKVSIKFDKFVNLIASHDYESIFQRHIDQDVVVSTDLLADLANAHQENEVSDRKVPFIFLFGILIGIVLMWIFLKT
jgi:hypothetical protein